MNVWPFIPQRRFKEILVWQTEVIRCKSAEQRICLRNLPRIEFEYDYQLLSKEAEAATNLSRKYGASEFNLPLWGDLAYIGTASASQTLINIDTTNKRFQIGGRAFIVGADNRFEIVVIDTLDSNSLTLESPGIVYGYSNAVIVPCYNVKFKSAFQLRKYAAEYLTGQGEFISTEDFGISALNNYPSFNSATVLSDRSIVTSSSIENHQREFDQFENISGPLYYSENYTYAISSFNMEWSVDNRIDLFNLRRWLYYIKGKQVSFYFPRFVRDFVLSDDIDSADDFLIFEKNGYYTDDYIGAICIVLKDGTQVYKIIESWQTYSSTQYQANLSTIVGSSISVSDVELVCRMPKVRSNTDRIEISYEDANVATVRIPLIEVPE